MSRGGIDSLAASAVAPRSQWTGQREEQRAACVPHRDRAIEWAAGQRGGRRISINVLGGSSQLSAQSMG